MKFILSIDQGTTSSRAVIFDENLNVVSQAQETFAQHFPQSDWVEHDLEEIWQSVRNSIQRAISEVKLQGFKPHFIQAISITNQRETFGLWEKSSQKPLGRAIVWQCRRSQDICRKLKTSGAGARLKSITGLVADPYFSGTKLKWLFDKNPELLKRAKRGEISFGTIDTFLISRLTGGRKHVTDATNASRTLMMDLKTLKWSQQAIKILGIPKEILPEILPSDACFGSTFGLGFLPDGIPLVGVLGDQQAALFGQSCFEKGQAKVTYGTGAFFLMNVGSQPKKSNSGLSTLAWQIGKNKTYAVEGAVFIAGAAVQFLRDGLGLISSSQEVEKLASQVADSDGVFFVPALTGLGSPHWVPNAKGLIGGLTRRSTKAHLARATLEGIAHSISDSFESLQKESGIKLKSLKVDGGAARNPLLLQIQSDQLQVILRRPQDIESTVRGVATLAAFALKWYPSLGALSRLNPIDFETRPKMSAKENKAQRKNWANQVMAAKILTKQKP